MITKYIVYNTLKKHLGNIQISDKAVNEIQQFMNGSLNELCKDLKQEFIESNKKRKIYGLDEHRRIDIELVKDFLYKKPEEKTEIPTNYKAVFKVL